ncbi:hypothetical protein CPB83DRAFT_900054 [Crepidotus variabilis]|uniref:DUF6589 domain-containing protein n=1 Tax=Crepidotus variabilis TaxID=179855 RepID=A0A9P6E3R1_9AGAR|nr:hypothetical protein CPB83DRAFT_900054 [Crepidotus variabilis]
MALTVSHKWICDAVARISEKSMAEVKQMMEIYAWLISYDNVNISFCAFSQRVDKNTKFLSGTAATVYVKPGTAPLSEHAITNLPTKCAEGLKTPPTSEDISKLAINSYPHIHTFMVHQVLSFLTWCPEFEFHTYTCRDNYRFECPPSINALPTGPDHITRQYLLGTVGIPEASYKDNQCLVKEWFRQLGWGSPLQQVKFCAGDKNSFERLNFLVFVFGWLHCQMAFANSLHRQYLGTSQGQGLMHAFILLAKRGLNTTQTEGPFYQDLTKPLYHITEAHILEDWLRVGGVTKILDLRNNSPEELWKLANTIVETRASSNALVRATLGQSPMRDRKSKGDPKMSINYLADTNELIT